MILGLFAIAWVLVTLLSYIMACWMNCRGAMLLPIGAWLSMLALWCILFQY